MTTATTPLTAPLAIPAPIRRGLRRVGLRIRTLDLIRGVGRLAFVMSSIALVGMALDFLVALPTVARWALWLGWVAAGIVAFAFGVVWPMVRRITVADLAAVAEAGNPELGERLVSAVELMNEHATPHGSRDLIAALAAEAEARSRGLNLGRAATGRTARRWVVAGAIATAMVVLPPVLRPDPFAAVAARFVAPWRDVERVGRFVILVRPGDAVVAVGSDVTFRAEVRPRFGGGQAPDSASLEWTDIRGRTRRVAMEPESREPSSSRAFIYVLKSIDSSMDYRIRSGGVASRLLRLQAVEPPAVADLAARVEPPSYTKFPAFDARDPNRLNAWEGSRITLRATPNRPVRRVEVRWPVASSDGSTTEHIASLRPSESGRAWEITLHAEVSGTYAFSLIDRDGVLSRPELPRRVRVVTDAPPTVALGGSDEPIESKADDVLLVDAAAHDDVAVARAELHYTIARATEANTDAPNEGASPARLDGLGTRTAMGQASLVLKNLDLNPGDEITYWLEVADNRPEPKGPNVARSARRVLKIVEKADPLLDRLAGSERDSLRERLEALRKAATENHQGAVQLRYAADAALRGNGDWNDERANSLERRVDDAGAIVSGLEELARDFLASGRFAPLSRPTRQVAEVEAEGARATLDQARRADDPARRLAELRLADPRLAAVKTRLDELIRKFDELARQDDDRRRLRNLAERQEELARQADELARQGTDPAALDRIRAEQEALRREVDELARRSPELRAEILAQRAREAEALAERTRELAERQREQERQTADPTGRAEALRALAREQQAIEDEARRLALDVDQPLQDSGRARLNVDAMAWPVDPLERGDAEQARQQIDQAEGELQRLARDLDDVRDDPRALAQRLLQRQEELINQANAAVREANTPEAKAALAENLRPLAERQQAIARLAAAIVPSEAQRGQAEAARRATEQFLDDLRQGRADVVPPHGNEARDALRNLANALPDPNQRRNQAQQKINEANNRLNQVAGELDRHLRETAPKPNEPGDPVAAARDLAKRVEPLVKQQAEAAALLAEVEATPDSEPQRNRAARRAAELADAIDALRQAAPPESAQNPPDQPATDWHVVGPFDRNASPFFPVEGPIDLKAIQPDKSKAPATWQPTRADGQGVINLGSLYPQAGSNVSAFGVAEIVSPATGPGRLALGSDDSLIVWLNGRKVYDFGGNRSFGLAQDRVNVLWLEGPNRLVVHCGNGDGDWKYAVGVTLPPTGAVGRQLARIEQLRRALPLEVSDTRAAVARLQQALNGQQPADDLAAELADELAQLHDQIEQMNKNAPLSEPARRERAADARRIATALRGLEAPDAPAPQAEAVRLAERAARRLEAQAEGQGGQPEPESDPAPSLAEAAQAARSLARRLTDEQSPAEQTESLARAQRGQNEPDAARTPAEAARAQHDLADDLVRLDPEPNPARDAAEQAMAEAVERADLAAQNPNADAPDALAQARTRAAEAVAALARPERDQVEAEPQPDPEPLPPGAPDDPDLTLDPAHAEAARDLAHRERHLRQRLQAVLAERVEPQEQLREQSSELGREFAAIRDQTQGLSGRAQGPANQAASLLQNQAPQAMSQGVEHLSQGRPDAARNAQRQAADHVENAARAAADLAAALREDIPPDADGDAQGEPSGLADAREAQGQASHQLAQARNAEGTPSARAAGSAADAMRQAAQGLRDASRTGSRARQLARNLADADPSQTPVPDPRGVGSPADVHTGQIDTELSASRSGRRWGELPGHLRTEILQMAQGRYREDYARLIQLYFREIAADAPESER